MKCIHCGKVSLQRERTDGRCPRCQHRFAFDPRTRPGAGTDAQFQEAIERVSGGGQLRFTPRQLWLAVHGKPVMPPPPGVEGYVLVGALLVALPGVAMALLGQMPGLLIMAVLGGAAGAAMGWGAAQTERERWADRLRPRFPFDVFRSDQLQPWLEVHGDIPGLLPPREADVAAEPPRVPADGLPLDRAVVTDRWETAQMLVANSFHLQHDCAVLSRDGYPDGVADAIKETLRRRPHLTVFALHDASPNGCLLPLDLRDPEWFPAPSVRVVDLGLRPETVRNLRLPAIPGQPRRLPSVSPRLDGLLSYQDRQWLGAGNVGELAAFPPEQVMRATHQAMVAAGPGGASGGAPAYDDTSWNALADWFRALGADEDAADGAG
jgi:DNA-directed RNA polymerase subunit RPC12/RpoP